MHGTRVLAKIPIGLFFNISQHCSTGARQASAQYGQQLRIHRGVESTLRAVDRQESIVPVHTLLRPSFAAGLLRRMHIWAIVDSFCDCREWRGSERGE